MSIDVLYTTRWNPGTSRPTLGHRSLTQPQARELYELIVSEFRPDGTADFVDPAQRDIDLTRLELNGPSFGHCDQLADPTYGFPAYCSPSRPTSPDAPKPAGAHRWGARRWGRGGTA